MTELKFAQPNALPAAIQSGLLRRMRRLFRHADERAILVPMDHGLYSGPLRGIEDPVRITRVVLPGADGLLVSPGFARAVAADMPADRALAIRAGAINDLSPVQGYEAVYAGIDVALRYDADWLVHTLYIGGERDVEAIGNAGALVEAADRYSVPVILEFLPRDDGWRPGHVASWARLGAELGASCIKTIYTGDPESFARVVAGCPVPVLIAGGSAVGTAADLVNIVTGAMAAGGAGLAIGRRVWQAADPTLLLRVLGGLVHGQVTAEEAVSALQGAVNE
jgi:fructose-bisphosphate aldolase/2-amino-3,7-dideoxy-D-threo-hept-6-ulosonate synthase